MLSPIKTVFVHYPIRAFLTIVSMLLVSTVSYKILEKKYNKALITKKMRFKVWILINYSLLLLFFTVLGRRSHDCYRYNLVLAYSYREVFLLGDYTLASQILLNILMFIPIGVICSDVTKKYTAIKCVLYGIMLSALIELLQLILKRGYFEFDDLLSNTIGTFIGWMIAWIGSKIYYCFPKRK